MTKTVVTEFPTGLGSRNQTSEPVSFELEWRNIERYSADLRYSLSKYDISDEVRVEIRTLSDHNGTIKLAGGREGLGTYQVIES